MTDTEINEFCDKMEKFYGVLPCPIHQPKQFAYKIRLYLHVQHQIKFAEDQRQAEIRRVLRKTNTSMIVYGTS